MDLEALLARLAELLTLTRDDLTGLAGQLRDALAGLAEADADDENLEATERVVDAIRQVEGRVETLDGEVAAREQRRADLLAQVAAPAEDPPADPPADETVPVDPPTDPVAIAAAVPPAAPVRTPIRTPARSRPAAATPATPPARQTLVAAAQDQGVSDGTILDRRSAIELLMATHDRYPGKSSEFRKIPVVTTRTNWKDDHPERWLETGDVSGNMRKIRDVAGIEQVLTASRAGRSLVASGGTCEPYAPSYGLADISTDIRPVRDSLVQMGAPRGGFVTRTPLTIGDFSGAVDQWTNQDDIDSLTDAGVRKPCFRVECPDAVTNRIYAVPLCLTFGNMAARSDPEMVEEATSKAASWHARFAERLLLAAMIAASDQPTTVEGLGAISDFLANVDRAAVAIRNRQRTTEDFQLEVWAPRVLLGILAADGVRTMPGDDLYTVNQTWVEAKLADRNITVHWTLEMPTTGVSAGQDFAPQGAGGTLTGWPDSITMIVSHPGAHLFGDQGILDFGIVRDSTLNARNDYQLFYETFEGHAYVGLESIAPTMDLCADGERAALSDYDPCADGS